MYWANHVEFSLYIINDCFKANPSTIKSDSSPMVTEPASLVADAVHEDGNAKFSAASPHLTLLGSSTATFCKIKCH
jgi:hypothetical protein